MTGRGTAGRARPEEEAPSAKGERPEEEARPAKEAHPPEEVNSVKGARPAEEVRPAKGARPAKGIPQAAGGLGGILGYELRRGFGGAGFRLGLLGAMGVVLGHLLTALLPLTRWLDAWQKDVFLAPPSAWLHWIGLDSATPWPTLLAMLLPLLAALPAAGSAPWDRDSGYLCQLRLRCTARQYRLARLAAVFCTAFAVTVLPLLADLLASTALLPVIRPDPANGLCPIVDTNLLGGWFYRCPLGYILGYTLFDGLFVGAWVCLALPAGRVLRGRGWAALAPFALFLLTLFAGLWSGGTPQTPLSVLLPFQPVTGLRAGTALGWPAGALLLAAAGWLAERGPGDVL